MTIVDDFLAHYSSEFYDPVKAHEYYELNKKLKGNQSAGLSKESLAKQREAQSYTSNQIRTKRKEALDANRTESKTQQEAHAARMEELRGKAEELRASIDEKLAAFIEDKKPQLLKIPPNASPKVRAFLEKQNAIKTQSANKAIGAMAKTSREERQVIGQSLRDVLTEARDTYAKSRAALSEQRKALVEKFDTASKTERQNIIDNVR